MSALFTWSSRRLALTLAEPPDVALVTCATSWVATWFTGSLVKESLVPLVTRSLATTSSGTTAATEQQPQSVFRLGLWKFGKKMYSVLNHLEPTWTSLNLSWNNACACEQLGNLFKFVLVKPRCILVLQVPLTALFLPAWLLGWQVSELWQCCI